MTPLVIIPLAIGILVCILAYRYHRIKVASDYFDLKNVGTLPGTNSRSSPEQQEEEHQALKYATSVELCGQFIDSPEDKILVTNQPEIQKLKSWLSLEILPKQIDWCAPFVFTFRLPNGLEIIIHIWEGYWCFTGGPARLHSEKLWKYLKKKLKF
jgi:hypothetical protein